MLPLWRVNVEDLVPELKEHGILLDESIMSSLDTGMDIIDEFHYVMYRLGKTENGLQIFYRCLRETQDECPQHRCAAVMIGSEGKNIKMQSLVSTLSAHAQRGFTVVVLCVCVSVALICDSRN